MSRVTYVSDVFKVTKSVPSTTELSLSGDLSSASSIPFQSIPFPSIPFPLRIVRGFVAESFAESFVESFGELWVWGAVDRWGQRGWLRLVDALVVVVVGEVAVVAAILCI